MQSSESISTIAVYDERPFFEKALVYGVAHGILSAEKIDSMLNVLTPPCWVLLSA